MGQRRHAETSRSSTSISPTLFILLAATLVVVFVSIAPDLVVPKGGPELGKIDGAKKEALAITLEINKLVISLATLVFGAIAALVISKDDVRRLNRTQTALTLLALLAASSAIYFSYFSYGKLVDMLSNNFLEFGDDALVWPRRFQVNSLGVAVVMLAALFLATVKPTADVHSRTETKKGESDGTSNDVFAGSRSDASDVDRTESVTGNAE